MSVIGWVVTIWIILLTWLFMWAEGITLGMLIGAFVIACLLGFGSKALLENISRKKSGGTADAETHIHRKKLCVGVGVVVGVLCFNGQFVTAGIVLIVAVVAAGIGLL